MTCKGKTHGHQFAGTVCLNGCGMTQADVNALFRPVAPPVDENALDKALEGIETRMEHPNSRMHSADHACAEEISRAFNETHRFGSYLGMVKRLGVSNAYQIFAGIRQFRPPARNPAAVFFFKAKKTMDARKAQTDGGKTTEATSS